MHQAGELDEPGRIAPLVVVPGDDLDLRAVHDRRERRIEDRRVRRLDDVRRDERRLAVPEDPLELVRSARSRKSALISSTDVSRCTSTVRSTSDPVGIGTRTANPCSLPASSGITRPIALAAPVDVGTRFTRGGAGAAEILVRHVDEALIAGVRVDRRHQAVADAEGLVQHLRDGCEAVRRARGVRDDRVPLGVVCGGEVHAEHDGRVRVLRGRRDDHLARAGGKMLRRVGAGPEAPGALEHDVDARARPRAAQPDPTRRTPGSRRRRRRCRGLPLRRRRERP